LVLVGGDMKEAKYKINIIYKDDLKESFFCTSRPDLSQGFLLLYTEKDGIIMIPSETIKRISIL
jgi:hypothetical protein